MDNITDEDINIIISQGNITKNQAIELLRLHDGDIVNSIVYLETQEFDLEKLKEEKKNQFIDEKTDNFDVDTSSQENLTKYREIVDDKDDIYNKKKIEREQRDLRIKEGKEEEKTDFSIEELYKLKRGNNKFNSICVL